jgi:ABC transporter substrate binding protein
VASGRLSHRADPLGPGRTLTSSPPRIDERAHRRRREECFPQTFVVHQRTCQGENRRAAERPAFYVDKLLKGANAAELPVEQPSTFELVINLKVAKSLGLLIPQMLLVQADTLIE